MGNFRDVSLEIGENRHLQTEESESYQSFEK